jgi:transposase
LLGDLDSFWLMVSVISMDRHRDSIQVSRLEVVETGRRRRWPSETKARIVEESFRGRYQASATARRHGIAASLLFKWRKAYREGSLDADGPPAFMPAVVTPDAPTSSLGGPPPRPDVGPNLGPNLDASSSRMEIVAVSGRRVIVDAGVDAAALARVLDVLEGR